MTKVMVNGFGWMYVAAVLDWYTKRMSVTMPVCSVVVNIGWKPG